MKEAEGTAAARVREKGRGLEEVCSNYIYICMLVYMYELRLQMEGAKGVAAARVSEKGRGLEEVCDNHIYMFLLLYM